jgi:hypothetical protein
MGRRSNASSNVDTSSDSDADKSGNGSSPRARRMVGRMPGKTGHWTGVDPEIPPDPVREPMHRMNMSSSFKHGHSLAFGVHSLLDEAVVGVTTKAEMQEMQRLGSPRRGSCPA